MPLAEVTEGFHGFGRERVFGGTCDKLGADIVLKEHRSKAEWGAVLAKHIAGVRIAIDMHESDVLIGRRSERSGTLPGE